MRSPPYVLALLLALALLLRQMSSSDAQPELVCDQTLTPESFYRGYMRAHLASLGNATNELLALAATSDPDSPSWRAHLRAVLPRWQYPFLYAPEPTPPAYADFAIAYGRMANTLDASARVWLAYLDDPRPELADELALRLEVAVTAMTDFRPAAALLGSCPELAATGVALLFRPA